MQMMDRSGLWKQLDVMRRGTLCEHMGEEQSDDVTVHGHCAELEHRRMPSGRCVREHRHRVMYSRWLCWHVCMA